MRLLRRRARSTGRSRINGNLLLFKVIIFANGHRIQTLHSIKQLNDFIHENCKLVRVGFEPRNLADVQIWRPEWGHATFLRWAKAFARHKHRILYEAIWWFRHERLAPARRLRIKTKFVVEMLDELETEASIDFMFVRSSRYESSE